MAIVIRRAVASDSAALTAISFAAKHYWPYPESYFAIWRDELTVTGDYIAQNVVFVAEEQGAPIGYYAIVHAAAGFRAGAFFVEPGFWLEHIFVMPDYIGQQVGTRLIEHARGYCRSQAIDRLMIFADPYATGFYDKQGAVYLGEVQSSISGRTVALYRLDMG